MRRYRVEFVESAKADIARSFEWGRQEWGLAAAHKWYRCLKDSVRKTLFHFPLGQPLAPESKGENVEIRQMIVGRYRVLFQISGRTVRVLHVRGAFAERTGQEDFEGNDE